MRYADVLLMAAELGSPKAQEYFDEVRKRAYTSEGTLSANYSQLPVTKENIMQERRLEFAFESINYWDLLRQEWIMPPVSWLCLKSKFIAVVLWILLLLVQIEFAPQKGFQIPYNQITLSNGTLVQNAGW